MIETPSLGAEKNTQLTKSLSEGKYGYVLDLIGQSSDPDTICAAVFDGLAHHRQKNISVQEAQDRLINAALFHADEYAQALTYLISFAFHHQDRLLSHPKTEQAFLVDNAGHIFLADIDSTTLPDQPMEIQYLTGPNQFTVIEHNLTPPLPNNKLSAIQAKTSNELAQLSA